MRSLSLFRSSCACIPQSSEFTITACAVDLDEKVLYVVAEGPSVIEVWKCADEGVVDQDDPQRIATYAVPASVSTNPWSTKPGYSSVVAEVLSLRVLPDTHTLAFITRSGDIITLPLDEEDAQPDVVGTVESGILSSTWSPDDALLVLVTGDEKLILMTSTFDVLNEGPLHPKEFGEDAPIAVGWGAKHTQFHGSLGKSAAQAALDLAAVGSSPDDDGTPRVSWRGDGAVFTVSAVLPVSPPETTRPRRVLRVYSREGVLSNTGEPVAGLEHTLAWRPSGNLIASTQRFGAADGLGKGREGRHDVVFFERNGLRHGEFGLREWKDATAQPAAGSTKPWGYRVKEVAWSADSNVLSVWIENETRDIVQLWTTGNYHWYLKQEIVAPNTPSGDPGRFTTVNWHPEDPFKLILTTPAIIIHRTYAWETYRSRTRAPVDTGSVAVFDGESILLTPFRTQNVPPPMASHIFTLPSSSTPTSEVKVARNGVPIHASFSPSRDLLAVLQESGYIQLFDLHTRIGPGRGKVMEPTIVWEGSAAVEADLSSATPQSHRQIAVLQKGGDDGAESDTVLLAVLASRLQEDAHDVICVVLLNADGVVGKYRMVMPSSNGRLLAADQDIVWQAFDGQISVVEQESRELLPRAQLPEFCFTAEIFSINNHKSHAADASQVLYAGLSFGGKLHVTMEGGVSRTIANNVTSFTIASNFLIFTTSAHVSHYAPLRTLAEYFNMPSSDVPEAPLPEWETRRVERGSRIVTVVPSAMNLVLQMPRGNLETINPRPLVMEIVRQDVDKGDYNKAFLACRKHRIDLNVLVEHNPTVFKNRLEAFVNQVNDVDYINIFLTSLGQGSLPAELVAELCDGIRAVLETKDLKKYINSILTAHVVKKRPDHEAGLALLLRLRDTEPQLVEDAVKYIIFLVDADRLFDTALGMYDFSLVLMIAQHAQKDPREYLPFLRELRALDQYYQRFRIDDHLKRYEKALRNLSQAGEERFDEAMLYVEKHKLYDYALAIWQATHRYQSVLDIYGDWLFERRQFREAAFVFRQAYKPQKSMVAHEKALDWQELFELALQENTPPDDLVRMAHRVAEDLSSRKRYVEAARILLDYTDDVREAIKALVEGSQFSEARRIIVTNSKLYLLEDVVYPGALECRALIAEELNEMREQLRKQRTRVRELRVRKVEEPDAFYGMEDTDLPNVDVMTDVSMAPTAFTRYTQAPSSMSRTSSKRSSRSKRKLERKVGSGRKGTVDEEEYLLKSLTKLVGRFNNTQADAANLLPHLLQFTEEHQVEGRSLQEELKDFEAEVKAAVEDIWTKSSAEGQENTEPADSWVVRMQEYEKQRQTDPLDKVTKPEVIKQQWTLRLPVDTP